MATQVPPGKDTNLVAATVPVDEITGPNIAVSSQGKVVMDQKNLASLSVDTMEENSVPLVEGGKKLVSIIY